MRVPAWVCVCLMTLAPLPGVVADASAADVEASCRARDLEGLQTAFAQMRRRQAARGQAAVDAGAREDFDRVASAVVGAEGAGPGLLDDLVRSLGSHAAVAFACGRETVARDRAAARLLRAGYSAVEVADVLTGVLAKEDLDRAYALRMAGASASEAAAYLEAAAAVRAKARAERAAAARRNRPVNDPPGRRLRPLPPALAGALVELARAHGLDVDLVRAVITAESGGAPGVVSEAGAIGLMQLMPATARMLGVDPWDPLDNLRGGITYLAQLVRAYGTVRDGLIAYNAGPSHAERVQRGEAVLYGETRRYLDAIDRAYPLDR